MVCEHAAGHRLQTLTARGSELECGFGFGMVRQLLEVRLVAELDAMKRRAGPRSP